MERDWLVFVFGNGCVRLLSMLGGKGNKIKIKKQNAKIKIEELPYF